MLRALTTITAGTAARPVEIANGEVFDPAKVGIDEEGAARLLAIGSAAAIAEEPSAAPAPQE
jgi:hypothetical protein